MRGMSVQREADVSIRTQGYAPGNPSSLGAEGLSRRKSLAHGIGCQRPFLPWPFKIRTTALIVFQFRVVAGTPNSLSIWPR